MHAIYFVGPYTPIMCGIADYTRFITNESPLGKWGVLSFDLEEYGAPLTAECPALTDRVWYGIRGRNRFSTPIIREGLE